MSVEEMLPSVRVRDAVPDDYPVIAAMTADWERAGISWGLRADDEGYIAERRCWVVCGGDGAVRGFLLGSMERAARMTSILPDGTPYFEIDELYVRPEHRGEGLGGALFRHAKRVLAEEGAARAVLLSTSTKDYQRILDFYIRQQGMTFWSARMFMPL